MSPHTLDAVEVLLARHRQTARILADIDRTEEAADKASLLWSLAAHMGIYMAVQESHFYPCIRHRKTRALVDDAIDRHAAIKDLLAEMLSLETDDLAFEPGLRTLRETIESDLREEEGKLFPTVRRVFSEDVLVALGHVIAVQASFPEERAQLN
jgi:hypothetical protein